MLFFYSIKKLHCPACATRIEEEIMKQPHVQGVNINVDTTKLRIESNNELDINLLNSIADSIEKGTKILPWQEIETGNHTNQNPPCSCQCIEHTHEHEHVHSHVHDDHEYRHDHDDHEHSHDHEHGPTLRTMLICFVLFFSGLFAEHLLFNPEQHPLLERSILLFCYAFPYVICGQMVLLSAWNSFLRKDFFNEFTLMGGATLAAIIIGHFGEAVGVMLFYCIGEYFQEKAAGKSRHSIRMLLASKPSIAHTCDINGNNVRDITPEEVHLGNYVLVRPGEKFPLDGEVVDGVSYMDTAPLTGEPLPVLVGKNDRVLAGCINKECALIIRVTTVFADTSIARILEMVENAKGRKSPTERLITRLARYYTPAVVLIAFLIATLPPLFTHAPFTEWLYKALVLLVISCPCALLISIPLTYFGGIGTASKRGILVKGGYVLDALQFINVVAFDKTGTLTKGSFSIIQNEPAPQTSAQDLLKIAALAESRSNHPIAKAIIKEALESFGKLPVALNLQTKEVLGKGIIATADNEAILVGTWEFLKEHAVQNMPLYEEIENSIAKYAEVGSHIFVAKNSEYKGLLVASDTLRPEAAETLKALRTQGIKTLAMLTGDHAAGAKSIAQKLDLDIVKSNLLPQDKATALESIAPLKETLFMGDGINDAPVLATAGIGVAMGGLGSEAAVETADVVILDDNPARVPELLRIGYATKRIVWQNIFMALGIKLLFVVLGLTGISGLWEAVFADVGVALLAVLNASRIMKS